MKKDKSNFYFRRKENQTLQKLPGSLNGSDFAISNCINCEIYIFDYLAQVFVDDCKNCKVYIGPTKGSIFVRDCQDIQLHSSSAQLRISDSKNISALIYSQSDPTLENTSGLILGPYNFIYPGFKEHFQLSELRPGFLFKNIQNILQINVDEDKWSQVFDFTPNSSCKNWDLLPPNQYPGIIIKEIEGVEGSLENPIPIPKIYGGDSDIQIVLGSQGSQNIGDMMSFNINTSQQQAQQVVEQQEQIQVEEQQQQEMTKNKPKNRKDKELKNIYYNLNKEIYQQNKQKATNKEDNVWEKVIKNIALKSGEYQGKTDVSRMRQAILNKRLDLK
ncbi:retinitis pigmentosa 2, putative [Ichthyophthirius multifiliis]|uniref:Retinitis pigmentosa 2, putative n=1 Tax=Ichthyophthirius multifiliis TaxID=5932 RepID=G0QUN2_ICHMU|nr:retinitis pigmentosa 2, putative [Ichthyophthirius multifiliis]EGR31078.1 retinitis pigmentosa 2, putative [Ichthyophthirius multifiliis]|eukprot:XP_004034564.1 retinitis pigmentosa 2, putative [Ichthyophthirius multifiliis]